MTRRTYVRAIVLASLGCVLSQCMTTILRKKIGQDQLFVTILAASLFNQRTTSVDKNWQGDWVLRRERLNLIDREFLRLQPDLIVLQEVMAKTSSAFDNDRTILNAGSLADFYWSTASVHYYSDSDEEEYRGVAAKQVLLKERSLPPAEHYTIGQDGSIVLQAIPLVNQASLALGNLYLPSSVPFNQGDLDQLKTRIDTFLVQQNLCTERLVLAGEIGDAKNEKIREFLSYFHLKDSAEGVCPNGDCLSMLRDNAFFAVRNPTNSSGSQRIFLPLTSQIDESSAALTKPQENKIFSDKYGFDQLWPTAALGWMTRVKFARCP